MTCQRTGAPTLHKSRTVGNLELSKVRQRNGISLEDIATKTKISIRFLRSIEAEEFADLPGGVFNTSYIRQYAAAIGFDQTALLTHYRAKTDADESVHEIPRKITRSEMKSWIGRWFGVPAQTQRS